VSRRFDGRHHARHPRCERARRPHDRALERVLTRRSCSRVDVRPPRVQHVSRLALVRTAHAHLRQHAFGPWRDTGAEVSMKSWLTVAEAAEYSGVSRDTIYTACERREIRHARVGGRRAIRLKPEWIDAWLERHTQGGPQPARNDAPASATTYAPPGVERPTPRENGSGAAGTTHPMIGPQRGYGDGSSTHR